MVGIRGGGGGERGGRNRSKCSITLILLCGSLAVNFYNSSFPKYAMETMPVTTATISDATATLSKHLADSIPSSGGNTTFSSISRTASSILTGVGAVGAGDLGRDISDLWSEDKIVELMTNKPNRAYFVKLFQNGNFRKGMEVGTAAGRFSEHFLEHFQKSSSTTINGGVIEWTIVEPFPIKAFKERFLPESGAGSWQQRGLLNNVKHTFHQLLSLDKKLLQQLPDNFYDFIYLDGDHSYKGVKQEMFDFWPKVSEGGVLAGHDYCNYGEASLPCKGCDNVPKCGPYTAYGIAQGKKNTKKKKKGKKKNKLISGVSANQNDVVKAVQEWMMETKDARLTLRFTNEDFTRESLAADGMDYDLVITNTRTPSWYIVKPKRSS